MNIKHLGFSDLPALLRRPHTWLVLLMLFHLFANIWWLWMDNHAIRTDEETHMIMARDYYNALFPQVGDRSLRARIAALTQIRVSPGNPVHPPVLHIAGAVLVRIIGYSVDRLAFVNTLMFLFAILGVYLLARLLLAPGEAVFAAAVFSFTPLIYTSSRYFMTDFASMALVVWIMYAMLRSDYFHNTRWAAVFALFNGLAILTRTTAVLYYILPAVLIYALGAWALFERGAGWRLNQYKCMRLGLNTIAILLISAVIAAPWYIAYGEQFYHHWMKPHQDGAGAPLAIFQFERPEIERPSVPSDSPSQQRPAPARQATARQAPETIGQEEPEEQAAATAPPGVEQAPGRWRLLLRRRIPWIRYPVFVINNGVFLPMFIMGFLGLLVCMMHPRFRKRLAAWLLICWLLGSYYMLTIVLSFATPRYAMQALPALALLSTFPILMLAKSRVRRVLQFVFLGLLLFQYGNLTVRAYGPISNFKIPVYLDRHFQHVYDDHGLYVYKSIIHASSAYGRMQAPMKENYKDRLFFAMLKAEQERPFYGIEANYARCNIRGMILDEQHFWLDGAHGNPFRRRDIPPELEPYRNFRHYGWSREIETLLPTFHFVDYVAYTTEGISSETEQEWLRLFEAHGFELIERFHEERFGMVPARYFGLVARKPTKAIPVVHSEQDIQALPLMELYRLRYSAAFRRLTPALQGAVQTHLQQLFRRAGRPAAVSESVYFISASVEHKQDDWYALDMVFYTDKVIPRHYHLIFQGIMSAEHMARHFNRPDGKQGVFTFSREPMPITLFWPAQNYVVATVPLHMQRIPYRLRFGFISEHSGVWGNTMDMGEVDFGTVPHSTNNDPAP